MNAIFEHAFGKFVGKSWRTYNPSEIIVCGKLKKKKKKQKKIEVAPITKISSKDLNRKTVKLFTSDFRSVVQ